MGDDSGIDKSLLAFVSGLDGETACDTKGASDKKAAFGSANRAGNDVQVSVAELMGALNDEIGFANLKKHLGDIIEADAAAHDDGIAKVEILAAPLPKHEQNKLERRAAYELTTKEANKWIPVIRANRAAKTLSFPTKQGSASLNFNLLEENIIPQTDLEVRMNEILKKSGMNSEEAIVNAEKLEMVRLTSEEIEKRYQELAKKRALLFFGEKKHRQQAKIKSKNYRKLVKREKERKIRKEVEKTGATLTAEELREQRMKAEMDRIRERMTLKTRRASKWAHEFMRKKRLETGSREEIMEQVRDKDRIRQEIMGKAAQLHNDDDEIGSELGEGEEEYYDADDFDNSSASEETVEPKTGMDIKKRKTKALDDDYRDNDLDQGSSDPESIKNEVDEIFGSHGPKTKGTDVVGRRKFAPPNPINKEAGDNCEGNEPDVIGSFGTIAASTKSLAGNESSTSKNRHAKDLHGLFVAEDDDRTILDDKTKEQLEVIRKAFAADDVFQQFAETKAAEVNEEAPKDIDLTLPGWGTWGGVGITPATNRVVLRQKDGIDPKKRKDANLANVIIHERRSKKSLKLMVDKVPFPFKNRDEYERSLSNPTGKEWNCTTNFTKNIAPRVQVKVGSIIDPIKFAKNR